MTRQDPTNDAIERWVVDVPARAPHRVLESVLAELPALSQQGRMRARLRRTLMPASLPLKLVGAAMIAVAIVVVGLSALPRTPEVGSVIPSPGSTAAPSGSAALSAIRYPLTGPLSKGSAYFMEWPDLPSRITFTVPADGWSASAVFVDKHHDQPTQVALSVWAVSHVYSDACRWEGALVQSGTTAAELVSALMDQEALDAAGPTDATVAGLPAHRLEVSVEAGLDVATCDRAFLRVWPVAGPDETGGLATGEDTTHTVYVVDLEGEPAAIVATHRAAASPQDRAELEAMVASIRIDPRAATSSPSPEATGR